MNKLFKRHTRREKEQHCKAWQGSGLSQSKYCREHGLKVTTFHSWLKKHSNKFMPIEVKEECADQKGCREYLQINIRDKLAIKLPLSMNEPLLLKALKELTKCI